MLALGYAGAGFHAQASPAELIATPRDRLPTPAALNGYSFTTLDGKPVSLRQFKGQGIILDFWATWCGPCVAEMPDLNRLAAQYKGRGLVVLAVSLDTQHGPAIVDAFFKRHGLKALTPYLDADNRAMPLFHLNGIPATYLLNPDGTAYAALDGGQEWLSEAMAKKLQAILPENDRRPSLTPTHG